MLAESDTRWTSTYSFVTQTACFVFVYILWSSNCIIGMKYVRVQFGTRPCSTYLQCCTCPPLNIYHLQMHQCQCRQLICNMDAFCRSKCAKPIQDDYLSNPVVRPFVNETLLEAQRIQKLTPFGNHMAPHREGFKKNCETVVRLGLKKWKWRPVFSYYLKLNLLQILSENINCYCLTKVMWRMLEQVPDSRLGLLAQVSQLAISP